MVATEPLVVEPTVMMLTTEATTELRRIVTEEGDPDLGLRVFVSPGGLLRAIVWHEPRRPVR